MNGHNIPLKSASLYYVINELNSFPLFYITHVWIFETRLKFEMKVYDFNLNTFDFLAG